MRSIWRLSILVFACSCSDPTASVPPVTLDGTWTSIGLVPGAIISFTLSHSDTVVTGTGHYAIEAGPSGTMTVSGSYNRPGAVLHLNYDSGASLLYSASATDGNTLQGTCVLPPGAPFQLTLVRQ
jgi:hypothetical protein